MRRLWKISKTKWYTKPVYLLFALVLVVSFSLVTAVPAAAAVTEVWVDNDYTSATPRWGVDHFSKIQDGIGAVAEGGTVNVAPGIYLETIDVTVDGLTIQSLSDDPSDTIIDGGGTIYNHSDVTISGFTITGGVYHPQLPSTNGIAMDGATGCHLSNLIIAEITTSGDRWTTGIFLFRSSNNIFENITISNILGASYPGIVGLLLYQNPDHSNNSFTDITIETLTNNTANAFVIGLFLWNQPTSYNTFANIKITNVTGSWVDGVMLKGAYNNTFESTEISSLTSTDDGAYGIALRDGAHNNTFNATTISNITASGEASGVRVYYGWTHDNSFTSTSISGLTGTPSYGIYITAVPPSFYTIFPESNSFNGGSISGAQRGVYIKGNCPSHSIHYTNIVGNTEYGAYSDTVTLDATNNWWGDASGPSGVGPGTGDAVSHNVDYDPWADRLLVLSGDGQTGTVGAPLANPFASQLKNSSGNSTAIKDVPVSWNITSTPPGATGQSLSDTDTTTDSNGQASSTLTLGNKVGTYTVTANVPGESTATFTATATAGSLDHIVVSPDTATITAGNTQAYSAEAFDQYDNNLGDVTDDTTFEIEAGAGGSWAANIYTSENAGTWTVTGTYGGKSDTATLTVSPAASHAVTLTADPINIPADGSSTSTITAIVKDQYGNNITNGTDVLFETDHGTFASDTITKQTSDGVATATLTSESSAETVIATVTATANDVSDATAVVFIPEGGAEVEESKTETVTGSGTVEDTPTGGDVTIDATGDHTITTAKYKDNPGGTPTFEATGDYYDVHLDDDIGVNSLTIEFCPADEDTAIYYWDGSTWRRASDQRYSNGCIVVTVTDSTSPSLPDLTGLSFASGTPYPPAPMGVGGEAYPVNKLAILAPWIALAALLVGGISWFILRRHEA